MTRLVPTGEMTLGPFFPREFAKGANDLTVSQGGGTAHGEVIEIKGRVLQGDGRPLDNAVLEIWQSNAAGRFDDPAFFGWGRAATDSSGLYSFRTIRPGACEGRAPHVNFLILFSGLMRQLQTAMFFEGDPLNGKDPVFLAVEASVRARIVAKKQAGPAWQFDIRTRGEGETPFFDD